MGGEKLKSSRRCLCALFALLFINPGIFFVPFPLSAQSTAPGVVPSEAGVDESTIILGETPVAQIPEGGSSVSVLLRMVLVLALAALAIYGVVFFIKRLSRPQENRDPNLKVLARVPLSNDSFAAVVAVGAKAWLVGGGAGGINLISEINDTESLETMLLEDSRRAAESGTRGFIDFRSLLSRFGRNSGGEGRSASQPGVNSITEKLRKQRERLRGL